MNIIDFQNSGTKDENLPVNDEFEHSLADEDALLSTRATPDQVRYFLTHLLINKRDLPLDHVRRAVARWRIGTGLELRSYSPAMYLDIFGREDGWVIYQEVRLLMLDKKRDLVQRYIVRVYFPSLSLDSELTHNRHRYRGFVYLGNHHADCRLRLQR
jgi:hypothetical protein